MNIYVGNLPPEVTNEELHKVFMTFGEVISVTIMNDKYIGSGQNSGYGYIEMASKSEAQLAVIGLQGKSLRGRVINVIMALPLSDSGNQKCSQSKKGRNSILKTRQR